MTGKEALAVIKSQFIGDLESLETDEWWTEEKKEADINWWKEKFQIVEKDLEVLEAFKNSLVIEYTLPVFDIEQKKSFNIEDLLNFSVKYYTYRLNKETQEKLTQWIIDNIDKETVRKWLENDNKQNN